ncbi:MAG: tetratricopeptide repeat protein, partial [Chthoniobacterales bacterium]
MREKALTGVGGALLLAGLLAAYGNHFQNSFHFDDAHTVVNNAAIRELRNVPRFFSDATTFSALPSNQSYRPLVSTLLAIDYSLGHGLRPFWFHLSIFALFVGLVLLVRFVVKQLLDQVAASPANSLIALAIAALYGLHPANADTVNYVIAVAEIMSALGIVGSFAIYFAFPQLRRYYLYVLPAALGVLAKPPTAIFPVLFALYRLVFCSDDVRDSQRHVGGLILHKNVVTTWLREIAPPFLICAAMLLFTQAMTPSTWISGAANARNYLITQPYVALLYFRTFFWPSGLSADYDLDPLTTTEDARFCAGVVFVALLVTMSILCACFKRTRVVGFGLLWFLVTLLPTSLFPLAEVMNDHRTFLPYIGLVIALAGVAVLFEPVVIARPVAVKAALAAIVLLVLSLSGYATFERNKVWQTEQTLWRDVTLKGPRNPRGLMNYGNTLMATGDFAGALDYFHRALALAPQYPVLLINLAVAEDATNDGAGAEQHFREALRLAPSLPDSYTFYARALLARFRIDEARALLQTALTLSPSDVTARDLLA